MELNLAAAMAAATVFETPAQKTKCLLPETQNG